MKCLLCRSKMHRLTGQGLMECPACGLRTRGKAKAGHYEGERSHYIVNKETLAKAKAIVAPTKGDRIQPRRGTRERVIKHIGCGATHPGRSPRSPRREEWGVVTKKEEKIS